MSFLFLVALLLPLPQAEASPDAGPPESLLVAPLFLGETAPEVRAARWLQVGYAGAEGARPGTTRTREEALALAQDLRRRLLSGASFDELVQRHGEPGLGGPGGHLGALGPGVLEPASDAFLFSADPGDLSEPLETGRGFHLVQRVSARAGCRQIVLAAGDPDSRAKAAALLAELRAGADFAALAREHSVESSSAARGGDYRVFERGKRDRLLKARVFGVEVGEYFGPFESPLGWHVGQRVPPANLAPELHENNWVRAAAVVIAHEGSGFTRTDRSPLEARTFAEELHALGTQRGTGLAPLARKYTDEPGARERGGDLGWIHRKNPTLLRELDRLFLVEPGTILEPFGHPEGWILVERTR